MAWISLIDESEAEGQLARVYDAARKRAGRVFNILKVQSNNAAVLQSMIELFGASMRGDSPLTRAQREMLALVVSKINGCLY